MRVLKLLGLLCAIAGLIVAFAFPTDDLVRRGLARVLPPGGPTLVFRRAVLRPWGLRLEQVTLAAPDGTALAALDWVRVRPSLSGFLRLDAFGRPWLVFAGLCSGTVDASVAPAADIDITAHWQGLALDSCPPLTRTDFVLAGRTDGQATIRVGGGTDPSGDGQLALHDFSIRAGKRQQLPGGLASLTADAASLRWKLADRLLVLDALDWHGPEVEATGDGQIRIAHPLERSELDLRLTVAPGPHPPAIVTDAVAALPRLADDPTARRLLVRGTISAPRTATPSRQEADDEE